MMLTRVSISTFLLGFVAMIGWSIRPISAAPRTPMTIDVTVNYDGPIEDGLTNDGECTLREAIHSTNIDQPIGGCVATSIVPPVDTISFRFLLNQTITLDHQDGTEHADRTGDLDILGDVRLTMTDCSRSPVITTAIGFNDRHFEIDNGADVEFGCLQITGGNASDDGGALYVNAGGSADLRGTRFVGNRTTAQGGAIFVESGASLIARTHGSGTLDQWAVRIADNSATSGGGIYSESAITLTSPAIYGNVATISGGGIYADNTTVTIDNPYLVDNTAVQGGAIYSEMSEILIDSAEFIDCDTQFRLIHCRALNGNSATDRDGGGAIYADGGNLNIQHVTFISNTVNSGTGIDQGSAIWAQGSQIILHNALVANNNGTAVHIQDATTLASVQVTYSGNSLPLGTTLSQSADNVITFEGNIIWGNGSDGYTGFATLFQDCNTVQALSSVWDVPQNSAEAPLFVDAANGDFHLQDSSPAIDRCGKGTAVDLDGNARPSGALHDRGAFESQAAVPTVVKIDGISATASHPLLIYLFALLALGTISTGSVVMRRRYP